LEVFLINFYTPITPSFLHYTVGHKKRDTFIFVITQANIDRFS